MADPALQDFYCSEKFTWLSVDLEKRQSYSCCAVKPHAIDLGWAKNNPGQLFNTPHLIEERQTMLSGQPVASCQSPCWEPERQNITSRRMLYSTQEKLFNSTRVSAPENLHIMLGSTCNMTCSYCCKQYSSAWTRDLQENGPYTDQDRFKIFPIDKILTKISQTEHQTSVGYLSLVEEIESLHATDCVYLTGGETFLYNNFAEFVNRISVNNRVKIFTGMGVNPTRFKSQLSKLINRDRITLIVSAENCNDLYEFNRFGNTWQNFNTNLAEIENQKFDWYFSSVISNLTIFGFAEFAKQFEGRYIKYEFCSDPDFLNVNVLDDASKDHVIGMLNNSNIDFKDKLISSIAAVTTEQHRNQLSLYLTEFARRRKLNLDIYPSTFVQWLTHAQHN